MSVSDLLPVVSAIAPAVAMVIVGTEPRLVRQLRRAGAQSASQALSLRAKHRIARWQLARLVSHGVAHPTSEGFYYLDEAGYRTYRARRRRRAAIVVVVLIPVIAALYLIER